MLYFSVFVIKIAIGIFYTPNTKSLFEYHENWVILSFHDPSSKLSGSHGWPSVWLSFGSLFSWLKYSKFWMWMMESENGILVFSKVENWNSMANVVNHMTLWAPYQCIVTSFVRLGYYCCNSPISFHFSPKFSAKLFPFLTSLSQPPLTSESGLFSFSLPFSSPAS